MGFRIPHATLVGIVSSLTFRCLCIFIVYGLAMVGLLFLVNGLAERELANAFPTTDIFDDHEDDLANDRFGEMSSLILGSSSILVYDGQGRQLYASNSDVAERITFRDLSVINGGEENRTFYEVLERSDGQAGTLYEIALCTSNEKDNAKMVRASCVCNADGTILSGDLFSDRESLTMRELSLIRGVYDAHMKIEKREYETADGQARTLVLVSPLASESNFDAAIVRANGYRAAAVPFALVLTVLAVIVLACMLRRSTRPLDAAIHARRHGGKCRSQSTNVPLEFRSTYNSFAGLMGELDAARDDKRRMIADVSHDLKTPLTVIRGYTQAFEDKRVPSEKAGEYLHAINEKTKVASDLLDSLLLYAKTDHPSYKAVMELCNICETTRQMLIGKRADIDQAGCKLQVVIPDEPIYARIDPTLLKRAFDNLVNNACAHNPPGTTVRVACRISGQNAVVSVADDGIGIPDSLRMTVFEPFVTGNEARESGKGIGLGLAIAGKCVQVQGGMLSFTNRPEVPYVTEVVMKFPLMQFQGAEST